MKREQMISVPSDMASSNTVPIVPYQRKRRSQRLQACSLSNEELNKILEPFLTHTDQTVQKRSNTLPTNANNEVPTPTSVINDEPTDEQIMEIELQILRKSVTIPFLAPLEDDSDIYTLVLDLDETLIHFE